MEQCDLLNNVKSVFDGFNEFTQLIFGFAFGIALSHANVTVGWIFFFIIVWELGVFLLFGNTPYYDPFFRIAYNCVFLLSVILGQYLYYGKTTFQDFLFPESVKSKNTYSGTKYQMMDVIENYLDNYIDEEEKKLKKQQIKNKTLFYKR